MAAWGFLLAFDGNHESIRHHFRTVYSFIGQEGQTETRALACPYQCHDFAGNATEHRQNRYLH